jgi:hypothetical protein
VVTFFDIYGASLPNCGREGTFGSNFRVGGQAPATATTPVVVPT